MLELSAMFNTAVLVPVVVGSNVTPTVQLVAVPSEEPHVVVNLKSVESVPMIVMIKLVSVVRRLFFTVTLFAVLDVPTFWPVVYVMLAGLTNTGTRPVPENVTVWGLLAALYVIVAVPDSAVAVDGVKLKLRVQEA